ncbi:uracil-DNA glycosylase [Candidatus Gracilibacteria bacterium]|nr:uracil-DNA glycosylase [Candidatus Gracilibacteria bacterium]
MLLDDLNERVSVCKLCDLCKERTNAVPGAGNENSDVMFIGEGPGKNEDLQGLPFVGAAGKFLDKMLNSIGMERKDIYIANVVKCRPPSNRDPLPAEVKACWPYLEEQIKLIKPRLIVTLGKHSMQRFLPDLKISEAHGEARVADGIWQKKQVFLPLYHPAAALYNPASRDVHFEDFKKIPLTLNNLKEYATP